MDVFNLDHCLVEDYQRFACSFTTIRASEIREQVDQVYATGRFSPEPVVSINGTPQAFENRSSNCYAE